MEDMPRPRLPHLNREVTRHGKVVWYVRVEHGPRIRLNEEYGTKRFFAEYQAALVTGAPAKKATVEHWRNSLGWLIKEFMRSGAWTAIGAETREQLSYQFERIEAAHGDKPFRAITPVNILAGQDARRAKPSDANKFVIAVRKLFDFAVSRGLVRKNPATGIKALPLPNRETGFHTWTEGEIAAYEARWPLGTRQRLALAIFLYAGLRVGDAARLGRQHVKDGTLTIRTAKTGEVVALPLLPPLAAAIAATPTGDLTFLVTARGEPFRSKRSLAVWFGRSCDAAGVPGSAHGLRKAAAVRCAEAGASETQLNAIFGWKEGSRESATYTRRASRAKVAQESAKLLELPEPDKKVRDRG